MGTHFVDIPLLNKLTVEQLRQIVAIHNLRGYSNYQKDELFKLIIIKPRGEQLRQIVAIHNLRDYSNYQKDELIKLIKKDRDLVETTYNVVWAQESFEEEDAWRQAQFERNIADCLE